MSRRRKTIDFGDNHGHHARLVADAERLEIHVSSGLLVFEKENRWLERQLKHWREKGSLDTS